MRGSHAIRARTSSTKTAAAQRKRREHAGGGPQQRSDWALRAALGEKSRDAEHHREPAAEHEVKTEEGFLGLCRRAGRWTSRRDEVFDRDIDRPVRHDECDKQ